MQTLCPRHLLGILACLAACLPFGQRADATGVPIDGFLPQVSLSLTRDFDENFVFTPFAKTTMPEPQLGPGGAPHYDIALVDTGAAVSLLNTPSRAPFGIDDDYPGNGGDDGFEGLYTITIGGASGFVEGEILDPLGLYAAGLQTRTAEGATLGMNPAVMRGQTNTSMVVVPPESDLPNVLGFSYLGQYATRIRSDQPQVFQLAGQTVRTPAVEFFARGSGGMGITRKASITISGSSPLTPQYVIDFNNPNILDEPWENPFGPTFVSGGLFLNASANDGPNSLSTRPLFLDTGASVTVLSQANADTLGFDVLADEPEFTVAVVGAGGTTLDVPGFFADSITLSVLGGDSLVFQNVPIIVLDIADPADPNNVIGGFLGTNLFSGRNLVIDPNPASAGGPSAGLYISDPVTTTANLTALGPSAQFGLGSSWSTFLSPDIKTIANVRNVSGGAQTATISANAEAWEVNVSGAAANQTMTLAVPAGVKLTTFSGLNIEPHGVVSLSGGTLDVQYVDIRNGGRLTGAGSIATGSGPIPGQVENYSGVVAPGNGVGTLNIEGRYTNGAGAILEMEIGGLAPGTQYDQLIVDGDAALAGALSLALVSGFTPAIGNSFTLIDLLADGSLAGHFGKISFPALPADRMWAVFYTDDSLSLKVTLPGDFDASGAVNFADLSAWAEGFGTSYGGDGFLVWQRNFNGTSGPGVGVPEPAGPVLMIAAAAAALATRQRRRTPVLPS